MIASRLLVMSALVGTLHGCSSANRGPDPVAQLKASGVSLDEQHQILTAVFAALVADLHEADLPAYLSLGRSRKSDPPASVTEEIQRRSLRAEPQSAQPEVPISGDGIPGAEVFVESIRRLGPQRMIVDTGVMAGLEAGSGYRFTLVKQDGGWRIEKREFTWIS